MLKRARAYSGWSDRAREEPQLSGGQIVFQREVTQIPRAVKLLETGRRAVMFNNLLGKVVDNVRMVAQAFDVCSLQ